MPPHELHPRTSEELSDIVREAARHSQPVVPWGAGTRQHLGYPAMPDASRLVTTALDRIIEHVAADMTVTTEAGIALGALQATLAAQQQWLPWEPPRAAQATIGGLLASAASGALRLGYGTPRDWVLGMEVVLGDGRRVKSGGKVVKNVAGYDTHKLHIGALGTLGVITSVTFKVFPLPEMTRTLLFACPDQKTALHVAEALRERPSAPISLVLFNDVAARELLDTAPAFAYPNVMLVARWAGVAAAVERQVQAASTTAARMQAAVITLDPTQILALWQQIADFTAPAPDRCILRAAAAPVQLGAVLDALHAHMPFTKQATGVLAYPGVGLCQARLTVPAQLNSAQAEHALAALRSALRPFGGYTVVEYVPPTVDAALDRWGPIPNRALMQALRQQWDPSEVLNRGRYGVS